MNKEIASRITRRQSTEAHAISRSKVAFEHLEEPIKNELTRRQLQPEPWGAAVSLLQDQVRDFERLACSGWVENELRYRRLFADFGEKKWMDAATAINQKTKGTASIKKISDDLRINYQRHMTVRKTGKRAQDYKDVESTRAIDRFYGKENWSSDELNNAAASMLVWPLFQHDKRGADLCLESAACLAAANVSRSWAAVLSGGGITQRDQVGNEILNQVHQIAELPKPWRMLFTADLESYWMRWKDAIELSDAFCSVYLGSFYK